LILTKDGQRSVRPLQDQDEYRVLLKEYFDVAL